MGINASDINNMIDDQIGMKGFSTGSISDGYHTFNELYQHRIVLFIAWASMLSKYRGVPMIRSKLHDDGTMYLKYFIVQVYLPTGQISYHLQNKYWSYCNFMETRERADPWDSHTSKDVLQRIQEYNKNY